MLATLPYLEETQFPSIHRGELTTLQVNLGYRCNQQCLHCHVNAGPNRTEQMGDQELGLIKQLIDNKRVARLDLTGGAPELHPRFRDLVRYARERDIHVIDRCNLTILLEPEQAGLAEFLAEQCVEVVASLPCYLEDNVDAQRGKGTFEASIKGLQQLNTVGFGHEHNKTLNLVYNPQGPSLPPPQESLQADYKKMLGERYGVVFNQLLTIANMPIQRFGSTLLSKNQFTDYMRLLHASHQDDNLASVMCRSLISVDWQGRLYDCDFNQMLSLPMQNGDSSHHDKEMHLRDLLTADVGGMPIAVRDHCYGCTAGQGSSCGGALR